MPLTTHLVDLPDRPSLQVREHDGAGQALLLVHGLASNAMLWDGVAARLADAGHRVVAVDQRGHGGSHRGDGDFSYEAVCEDLVALVAALDLGRPVVAGQSWGGNVVIEAAARHPETFAAVCAVDGGFIRLRSSYDDPDAAWAELTPPDLDGRRAQEIEAMIRQRTSAWPAGAEQAVLGNFQIGEDGTVTPHLRREDHEEIVRQMWATDPLDSMHDVAVPVLLLPVRGGSGEWERTKQAAVEQALAALPDARVRWLSGDHDIHLQHPDLVADELLTLVRS